MPYSQVTNVDVVQADLVHPLLHRLQQAVDILVSSRHPGGQWTSSLACADVHKLLMPHGLVFLKLLMFLSSSVRFQHYSPGTSSFRPCCNII